MKLDNRKEVLKEEYRCELTRELDTLAKLINKKWYDFFHHYIYASEHCKKDKILAIRVPGRTVGGIWIDENNVIIKINIDTDYVIKTYPSNVNELIKKYVGEEIVYE